MSIENTNLREQALGGVFRTWKRDDPQSALASYREISDERVRNQLTSVLATELFGEDRDARAEFARSLPVGPLKDRLMVSFGMIAEVPFELGNDELETQYYVRMNRQPEETMRELLQRADRSEDQRVEIEEFLTKNSTIAKCGHNAGKVAALAEVADVPDDDFRRVLLEKLTSDWAAVEPTLARTWAEALPEGPARERALAGLAAGWSRTSINEVTTWLDALPPSPSRNAAIGAFASSVLERDPSTAVAWLRNITDQSAQFTALQTAWLAWSSRNHTAAEQWRRTASELTAPERRQLSSAGR